MLLKVEELSWIWTHVSRSIHNVRSAITLRSRNNSELNANGAEVFAFLYQRLISVIRGSFTRMKDPKASSRVRVLVCFALLMPKAGGLVE